jgi:UDPglucose 6-dehydrogenase
VCEEVGADVRTVAHGMGLDHRIGPHFLQAGIGYGGSCFPKDVQALKQLAGNSGYHFQLLNAVIEVNHLQKRRVVNKLKQRLGQLRDKRIALLGLTFKPNTDDLREAASIVLAARLHGEGAVVSAYDPMVPAGDHELFPEAAVVHDALTALRGADAAVLVTDWAEFARLDWAAAKRVMRRALIVDGRNSLDGEALRALGFEYEGVGLGDGPAAVADLDRS